MAKQKQHIVAFLTGKNMTSIFD